MLIFFLLQSVFHFIFIVLFSTRLFHFLSHFPIIYHLILLFLSFLLYKALNLEIHISSLLQIKTLINIFLNIIILQIFLQSVPIDNLQIDPNEHQQSFHLYVICTILTHNFLFLILSSFMIGICILK